MPGLLALVDTATTAAPATGNAWGWLGTALQLIWVLFLFALVIFLAYITTRVVGRRFAGSGRYLRVVDSLPLGQNRSLSLVEVSGEIYCVGITDHGVSLLGKIAKDDLIELAAQPDARSAQAIPLGGTLAGFGSAAQDAFGQMFDRFRRRGTTDPVQTDSEPTDSPPEAAGGEFADRIREQIERLRKIGEQDQP